MSAFDWIEKQLLGIPHEETVKLAKDALEELTARRKNIWTLIDRNMKEYVLLDEAYRTVSKREDQARDELDHLIHRNDRP